MATVTFKGTDINTGSSTTYTFSAKDIGTPSSTRIIVVAVHQVGGTGSKTVTGTVDGVALTNIQQGTGRLHLAYAVVNTANATGDIALTFSSAPARCAIGWWYLDGYNTTHSDVDSVFTTADASRTLTALTIPTGGVGIIVGVNVAATAITTSISAGSITEDYDTAATGMEYVGARTTDAGTPTITMNAVSSMAGFAFAAVTAITASAGSYAFTGQTATLKHGWKLAAAAGGYTYSGTDAAIRQARKIAAGTDAYVVTGADANLTLATSGLLVAGAGSYSLSGSATAFLKGWEISDTGPDPYLLDGQSVTLVRHWMMSAGASSYSFTGMNADFTIAAALPRPGQIRARVSTSGTKASTRAPNARARVRASAARAKVTSE